MMGIRNLYQQSLWIFKIKENYTLKSITGLSTNKISKKNLLISDLVIFYTMTLHRRSAIAIDSQNLTIQLSWLGLLPGPKSFLCQLINGKTWPTLGPNTGNAPLLSQMTTWMAGIPEMHATSSAPLLSNGNSLLKIISSYVSHKL